MGTRLTRREWWERIKPPLILGIAFGLIGSAIVFFLRLTGALQ